MPKKKKKTTTKRSKKVTPKSKTAPPFDREKHVYKNDAFVELVKDAVRFFNGTPVHPLPPPERFYGTGIYALYYTGKSAPYAKYSDLNRLAYEFPIYLGKAVPQGWRQARTADAEGQNTTALYSRIRQHANSIVKVSNLNVHDFACRFMIFEGASSDMIGTLEASVTSKRSPNGTYFTPGDRGQKSARAKPARESRFLLESRSFWATSAIKTVRHMIQVVARRFN